MCERQTEQRLSERSERETKTGREDNRGTRERERERATK